MIPSLPNNSSSQQRHPQQLPSQQHHQLNRHSMVEALPPFRTGDVPNARRHDVNPHYRLQHPTASLDMTGTTVQNSQFLPPEQGLRLNAPHGPVMTGLNGASPVAMDPIRHGSIPPAAGQHLLSNAGPSTNVAYNTHQSLPHQYDAYPTNVDAVDQHPSHLSGSQLPRAQAAAAAAYVVEHGKLPNDGHSHPVDANANGNVDNLLSQSQQSLFYHLQQPYNQHSQLQQHNHHHHHHPRHQQPPLMIPTVLPYVFPPQSPGPTAPATPRSGPYGPFWPDGVYIPYRPAATSSRHRDSPGPAFRASPKTALSNTNTHVYNAQTGVGVDVGQSVTGNGGIEQSHLNLQQPHTQRAPVDLIGQSGVAPPLASPPPVPSGVSWNNQGHHQYIPSNHKVYTPQGHVASNFAQNFHHEQQQPQQQQQQPLINQSGPTPALWDHRLLRQDNLPSQKIQQARLNDAATMKAPPSLSWQEQQLHPRRYTFQQPVGINYSDASTTSAKTTDSLRLPTLDYKEQLLSYAHSVYLDLLTWLQQSKRKDAALTAAGVLGGLGGKSKPNIYPRPPKPPGKDSASIAHGKSQVQAQGHFLDDNGHPANVPLRPIVTASGLPSPIENAISTLDKLSTLCVESGWNWIDGVLVGGCLAYGLEDYHKALRWYTRILDKDPLHVEALSNLAATFLALDRREEALERWLQAVKLRPSYFEAVEHLIGLLCTNQRPHQAVEIVSFVQASLRLDSDFAVPEEIPGQDIEQSYLAIDADDDETVQAGFGSSGYAVPAADNGRMLALIHSKGNLLYSLGQNDQAAITFEDAILVAAGSKMRYHGGMQGVIRQVIFGFGDVIPQNEMKESIDSPYTKDPPPVILAFPDSALQTVKLAFRPRGDLPGLRYVREGIPKRAATSTLSNSLLSLAKIYQDNIAAPTSGTPGSIHIVTVGDILALYYLSLSLQPSPSTANNVGILLSGIQQNANTRLVHSAKSRPLEPPIPGVVPGSGVALALAYYHYGLHLDNNHAHLYTNLGSLLKDIGHLNYAIRQYENAVQCDGSFDIALANLANALKDSGRVNEAIEYYRRAVQANPDFAEAVCGLSNALNSVCNWAGRGGIVALFSNKSIVKNGIPFCAVMQDRDRWHVNDQGLLCDSRVAAVGSGWIQRVVDIVDKQLQEGRVWGRGLLNALGLQQNPAHVLSQLGVNLMAIDHHGYTVADPAKNSTLAALLRLWSEQADWEGSRVLRLIERAIKYVGWLWYQDRYVHGKEYPASKYARPRVPAALLPANAPTVLPFHTFTAPLSAKQIRQISQRNGLRISCSTLRSPWLPQTVYCPPPPPQPCLNVGYVSSDFNNHPLAHLMQSVFGYHNPTRVRAFCYATSASDGSIHRQKIEKESPVFRDVSAYSTDRLVQQIVSDGIHILVNLNGYTRGARNEVFAARPAPIHMSFMGFAGTLGAEWCDYILCDQLSIPLQTLSPLPRHLTFEQKMFEHGAEDVDDWVYGEKIVFTKHTFFCCDHRQSCPDGVGSQKMTWDEELARRWSMRKKIFPNLPDDFVILGNFNQLYKIDPTTFRTWLRILAGIPNAVLWLLRFPELGEHNLRRTALAWAGESIASRIVFTDVAPKQEHISRARVIDLCLDTPECNAHTTAADVLWSGTPIVTFPRYPYKMCSRMASSILNSALPQDEEGRMAASELIVSSDQEYEEHAIALGRGLRYDAFGRPAGRLAELRKMLVMNRWNNMLFDTRRWVDDLEDAYEAVWENWVSGEEGDIWLESRHAAALSRGDVKR